MILGRQCGCCGKKDTAALRLLKHSLESGEDKAFKVLGHGELDP